MEIAYNYLLWGMLVLAAIVFVILYFVRAGYGILSDGRWGPKINNRIGWLLMEAPVFIAMLVLWWTSPRAGELAPIVFLVVFELHYINRAFIYPFMLKGKSVMPLGIVLMGITFNLLNAAMQGGWIFWFAPEGYYTPEWLTSPQFIIGVIVFFVGMVINIQSDGIIRSLRRDGNSGHHLPRGGMFRYVSSANYFGEIVEWTGFAILTWSFAGAVFAIWTAANLVPRANAIYNRYIDMFGEEFTSEKRKRIFPFIY